MHRCTELAVDVVNYSYGEGTDFPNTGWVAFFFCICDVLLYRLIKLVISKQRTKTFFA